MDSFFHAYWGDENLLADTGAVFDYHYDAEFPQSVHDSLCPVPQGPLRQCPYCFPSGQEEELYELLEQPQQNWADLPTDASSTSFDSTALRYGPGLHVHTPSSSLGASEAQEPTASRSYPQHHATYAQAAESAQTASSRVSSQSAPFGQPQGNFVIRYRDLGVQATDGQVQRHDVPYSHQHNSNVTASSPSPSPSREVTEDLHDAAQPTRRTRNSRDVDRLSTDSSPGGHRETSMPHSANDRPLSPPAQSPTMSTASSTRPARLPRRTGRELLHGTFKCSKCDCRFDKCSDMIAHQNRVHMAYEDRPYACDGPGCEQRFVHKKDLRRHEGKHGPPKGIICPHCHKTLVGQRRDNLKRHVRLKHPRESLTVTTTARESLEVAVDTPHQASPALAPSTVHSPSRISHTSSSTEEDPMDDLRRIAAARSPEPASSSSS
ncbi:hypothetical protein CERZMDRAFT_102169 [Cercospora zeae-maydis SCOH1-5]|uniref:C2H2-type domain-containing protein n=1 Tax=Cercospora zeae-maydis SCOH1-5 TaxID=717836 RepID=A0A6A6F1M9_9PEZI|nr:hypothetical protein CERZMDRAFT_102169 [Cercospora zeae-maydis SCOH1-5]